MDKESPVGSEALLKTDFTVRSRQSELLEGTAIKCSSLKGELVAAACLSFPVVVVKCPDRSNSVQRQFIRTEKLQWKGSEAASHSAPPVKSRK